MFKLKAKKKSTLKKSLNWTFDFCFVLTLSLNIWLGVDKCIGLILSDPGPLTL